MAVTFAITTIHRSVFGNKRVVTPDVNGIDVILMDAQTISSTSTPTTAADVGYQCGYDYENSKLVITESDGDAGAHVVSNDDVGDAKVRALVIGY